VIAAVRRALLPASKGAPRGGCPRIEIVTGSVTLLGVARDTPASGVDTGGSYALCCCVGIFVGAVVRFVYHMGGIESVLAGVGEALETVL